MLNNIKNTISELADETLLVTAGFDSLGILEIVCAIEEITGTPIPDSKVVRLHTINDLKKLIDLA